MLRIAAGDGLLTADELDERLEAALSVRTLSELAPLTTDGPQLVHSRIKYRHTPADADTPVTLRVELVGPKAHGGMVVRPPRRTLGQWLWPFHPELHG